MTRRLLILAALAALAACEAPTAPSERDSLAEARARWQAHGSLNYTFELTRDCFCLLGGRRMAVTVRDGSVTGAEYLDSGDAVELTLLTYVLTVPDLFDLIESSLDRRPSYFSASYDLSLGYPLKIVSDPLANAVDDEFSITVRNLRLAPSDQE